MSKYFGESTLRIRHLREKIHEKGYAVCSQRARILTEAYQKYESYPIILKRAMAFRDILSQQDIFIEEGDMLAGNQGSFLCAAPVFPEYSVQWILDEMDEVDQRSGDKFFIGETQKEELRKVLPWWIGKTLQDHAHAIYPADAKLLYEIGVIRGGHMNACGDGHIVVNYDRVLREGLIGFKEQIKKRREKLNLANYDEAKQDIFLQAAEIALDAVICFAHRHAELAEGLAQKTHDPARRSELLRMAEACRHVPEYPPRSFYEGLQAYWFVVVCQQIESNGHSVSLGRFDQYMYPLYKKALDDGADRESLLELLENMWLKLYSARKFRCWKDARFAAGGPMYENVTIGGQTSDGRDAVNELSFAVLKSVARVHLTQPNLTVRYHRGLSHEFMSECIHVIKEGFVMPAFNNDEVIIPDFERLGITQEDAYSYSAVGCVEVAIPGKFGHRCTGAAFLNFPKILNIVMRGGIDDVSGRRIYIGKQFGNMTSFEELFHEWSKAMSYFAKQSVVIDTYSDMMIEEVVPEAFNAALVDDCIDRGKNVKEGGAHYDFTSGLQVGIANTGNALTAIKKLVFAEKKISCQELQTALDSNFEGIRGEQIRQMLLNRAPKFGTDNEFVDEMTVAAYNEYLKELPQYRNTRYGRGPIGGTYYGGTSSVAANVIMGSMVSATADGRKAYTPLAEGCSPTQGSDHSGTTAVFCSMSRLPVEKLAGGILLNQKLSPSSVASLSDEAKLENVIRTFFDRLNGFHVQYNIVDRTTLEEAKVHPEKHKDLIVRVAGYSAFFTVLNPQTQDDIISRTEQFI